MVGGDDVEFLREFAAAHNLRLSIAIFPFMGIWELPSRDVVDVAASGISRTPDRMTSASFWSEPYASVRRSALVLAEDSRAGYDHFERFSVVGESEAHTHATRYLPKGARLQLTPSIESGVGSLLRGETDAVGTGSVSAVYQADRDKRLKVLDLQTEEDTPELISFSIRREQSLLEAINDFIISRAAKILIDDKKDRIYRRRIQLNDFTRTEDE